jgi:hypothetical protein
VIPTDLSSHYSTVAQAFSHVTETAEIGLLRKLQRCEVGIPLHTHILLEELRTCMLIFNLKAIVYFAEC